MGRVVLSDNFYNLIKTIVEDKGFRKIQYYMRCMKKAPHGGKFYNNHQSIFLRYHPIATYPLLSKESALPFTVEKYKDTVADLINEYKIDIEELLTFCFCVCECNDATFYRNEKVYGNIFIARASGALHLRKATDFSFEHAVGLAIEGKIKFTDCFNYDYSRLLDVFILKIIELSLVSFNKIEDVLTLEQLHDERDKYGLSDVTSATFDKQGFTIEGSYCLYNIFFDTSIGSLNAQTPKLVELMQNARGAELSILMRRDNTLSVPVDKKVVTATIDMQKWRGNTLNFEEMEGQFKIGKNVIVHYDSETMHKVLTVINPSDTIDHRAYYDITVEQLWSPKSLCADEDIVLCNFVHGCYYPDLHSFDHVDFSVNQYEKETYVKKYQDDRGKTEVPIEQHSSLHYKVWCIRGDAISLNLWSEIVFFTLDEPFRKLFAEIIGTKVTEEG